MQVNDKECTIIIPIQMELFLKLTIATKLIFEPFFCSKTSEYKHILPLNIDLLMAFT